MKRVTISISPETMASHPGARRWSGPSRPTMQQTGVLSMQVLQEFYVNVSRKIAAPLPKPVARAEVDSYTVWCTDTTPAEISAVFRIEDEAGIGFWDALIVAAARKAGAAHTTSEVV